MSQFKCKTCGNINKVKPGAAEGICTNCGAKQSLPDDRNIKEEMAGGNARSANVATFLKRAFMFLEDENWSKADEYCEKVLDLDPENAQAYLGKLMAEVHAHKQEDLKNCSKAFESLNNYQKILRFADTNLAETLKSYNNDVKKREQLAEEEKQDAKENAAKKRKKIFAVLLVLALLAGGYWFYLEARKAQLPVGKTITFGAYEQDNNKSNGKEPIEWQVLANDGRKALLISKYALDAKEYEWENFTWEKRTLRTWLNDDFYKAAFSTDEQKQIITSNVSADKNPKYSTDPGKATQDKVFLLSITEAEKYFSTDEARKCAPTAYAEANGAWTSSSNKTADGAASCCWWWLRSPGYNQITAALVYDDGSVDYFGVSVLNGPRCVRPALWINLYS